ncbi:hypothetical protein RBH94_05010 [Aestuariibaculum sp. YM273]|uniref:hypothetical protein n=1 Tax=Aestuariibaculum sp. YM273 TaxID=3070659 RepID=UPI0027DC3082|nr:hypothetical protein [Aestuariibaculum sp. YM273]WMI66522.1 hypothetical protein RBH94_05010 [Aestuariibaculum sp. YM273]
MIFTSKTLCFYIATIISYVVFSQDKPEVNLGGALRFNYNLSSWKDGQKKRGGDFGYDFFRINTKAKYKGVKLNAEYRFYSNSFGGGMLKQGWIGYDFNAQNNLQMGLTQVPFGITQYNSHNWFFGINYYLGMEDDHDMGIKFSHEGSNWEYALAFFKNAEELNFGSNSDVSDSRYSYDVGSIDLDGDGNLDYRNKEVNQVNAKINYLFSGKTTMHKLGASIQYGGLYNLDTENMGSHYAIAIHYELFVGHFDVKAQLSKYKYNPENPLGEANNVIAMTAYGAPYLVASEGSTYTLGAAYNIPVKWHPVSNIQIYNDFGYINKNESDFENTLMNVTGALITAGNIYTYVDFAAGKNQPWLGPVWTGALASGTANANWEMRFNVNIGYYF